MICVYRHIRLDKNEPFYIGIGSIKRAYEKRSRNNYWKNIVKKTDYRVDILFDDLTWEEACEKEKEFIKLYGRKDLGFGPLVNMTDGGEGTIGRTLSDKSKLKISKANKGRKPTEDVVKKTINTHRSNNKKRIKGVHWCNTKKTWIVRINKNKNPIFVGYFDCFAKALYARKRAEIEIWDNDKEHFIKKRIKGINWDKRRNNWQVKNTKNGKNNYIGSSQHFCKALNMLKNDNIK